VRAVVEAQLAPLLLGRDPREVEKLWELMYRITRWYGRKGAAFSAIGAVETACWDLRGKDRDETVAALLGAQRTAVPAYASALLWADDPAKLGEEAGRHVDAGFRRVKMRLGMSEERDIAAVRAVRQAVGPTIDVIVDASMRYSPEVAERMGGVLSGEGVFWYEEPFEPEEIDRFVNLRAANIGIPIAAGENEFGFQGFRELIRAGALDIVQPDACRAGGIGEVMRTGRLAAEHGARVATHTWSDAVALTANAHAIAALPNGITVEVDRTGNPFIDELLVEPIVVRDGLLQLSGAPGLGIELNMATVDRLRVQANQPVPDGNYSDMVFGAQHLAFAAPYVALEEVPA
jgi:D-galactarolactone cycloisomerase